MYPEVLRRGMSEKPMQEPMLLLEHSEQMYDKVSVDECIASNRGILQHTTEISSTSKVKVSQQSGP